MAGAVKCRPPSRFACRALVAIPGAESRATLTERVTTDRPFVERLVSFWSNHLCVSVGAKILVAPRRHHAIDAGGRQNSAAGRVMTEFGRTARPNGTRGTDHGTAGAGFIIGPKVATSVVHADWPGLGDRALFEGRDLKPTLGTRAVLKAAIAATFDLTPAQSERVFPGSTAVRGAYDLMG